MSSQEQQRRLARLLALTDREDSHLLAVRHRLPGDNCSVDTDRVSELLASDTGVDRLESFGAKFARMQDAIVDRAK